MILDYIIPEYDYEVSENQLGDRCVVKGRLTLHCKERDLVVEALGNDDLNDVTYGGAVCDASAMALRRCCASLGLGRYLYKDKPNSQQKTSIKAELDPPSFSTKPENEIERRARIKRENQKALPPSQSKPLAKGEISPDEYYRRKAQGAFNKPKEAIPVDYIEDDDNSYFNAIYDG